MTSCNSCACFKLRFGCILIEFVSQQGGNFQYIKTAREKKRSSLLRPATVVVYGAAFHHQVSLHLKCEVVHARHRFLHSPDSVLAWSSNRSGPFQGTYEPLVCLTQYHVSGLAATLLGLRLQSSRGSRAI